MYRYTAYNLGISSEIELPNFPAAEGNGDLSIRWDPSVTIAATAASPIAIRVARSEASLSFHEMGHFTVRRGSELAVSPVFHGGIDAIRLFLSGILMGTVLYQRGHLVLHASCVNIAGKAFAFMGPVAAGKSSLAAALYARGHSVVADDNTAIAWHGEHPWVLPAFPHLKVSPEMACALGYDDADLRVLHPLESKRGLTAASGFPSTELPLQCIYLLTVDTETGIAPLPQKEVLIHLIAQSMPTRLSQPDTPEHFLACARLAGQVPAFLLRRTQALAGAGELARTVERHALSLA